MRKTFFSQRTGYSCGLASVRNVLAYCHGLNHSEEELEMIARKYSSRIVEKDGFGPKDLAKMVSFIGRKEKKKFKITFSRKGTLSLLQKKLQAGTFPIIHIQTKWGNHPGGHYSFVYGVTSTAVYLFDVNPRMGHQKLKKEFFNRIWINKKLGGEKWVMLIEERKLQ